MVALNGQWLNYDCFTSIKTLILQDFWLGNQTKELGNSNYVSFSATRQAGRPKRHRSYPHYLPGKLKEVVREYQSGNDS